MPELRRWYRRFFGLDDPTAGDGGFTPKRGGELASAGVEMAGGIGLFCGLGYLVDRWLGTYPWGLVTGAVLGLIGGLYLVMKAAQRAGQSSTRNPTR